MKVRDVTICAFFTSLIAVVAQLNITMPAGIPFTLQIFGITLTSLILGFKRGVTAVLIYVLIGLIGFPVFAGFSGGVAAVLVSPTAGFIVSFPLVAGIIGFASERTQNRYCLFLTLLFASFINFLFGLVFFMINLNTHFTKAVSLVILPYVPTTILQLLLAMLISFRLKRTIKQHGRL